MRRCVFFCFLQLELLWFQSDEATGLSGILSHSTVLPENFPSRVSRTFGGKSLVLSLSGDAKVILFN